MFKEVELDLGLNKYRCNSETNNENLGIIVGDVLDFDTNEPIVGAIVSLFKKNTKDSNIVNLITLTYTNEYGQFAFKNICMGIYTLKINALGYTQKCIEVFINKHKIIYPIVVKLKLSNNCSNGTVSGIIMNSDKIPIERADVVLYKVEKSGDLLPIAFTKTNKSGVYLFMNVPKGSYKIKANETKDFNISISKNLKNIKNPPMLMSPLKEDKL